VVPVDDSSCILVNRISGKYVFPGSSVLGERMFARYMPAILDDDNQLIAIGCGALPARELKLPKGLLAWPLMAWGGRFVKRSTRRDVLRRPAPTSASSSASTPAAGVAAGAVPES
jgi:hypothetical protein